jgi:NodT family efflux transporter outer membrane factor (OMF) lipoprotein
MKVHALARFAAFAALAALVAACALRHPPDAGELQAQALPHTQTPPQWAAAATNAGTVAGGWIRTFHEPELETLVAEAIAYNPDLRIAAARVEAAEAAARAAGASLYPQVNLAGRGGGKLSGDGSGLQGLGLFASWELDLWGRVRAQRASATAKYESAVLDTQYARASIAATVAKSWFLAREAEAQGSIARDMVASSESLAGLSRDRVRVGNADDLEVAQAEASVLTYRDLALQADLAKQNALRAIEILAGRYPSGQLDVGTGLAPPPGGVPVGLPSQLLERRPDVRAAERRVAAAFYATQEAQAARLPRIGLTASVSSISSDLFVLKERDNPVWSWGGTITAPIFNAGALRAQVDVRSAEQKAAVAEYARIGSRAFSEVENALSASFNLERRVGLLEDAVRANERALGFARVRYDVGSADQRGVQNQLLALQAARTSFVHVQSERLIQRVNLYLALGGGFDLPAEATTPR